MLVVQVPITVMDDDIRNGLEVICDHAIYKEYLSQLGIVTVRARRKRVCA